MKKLMSQILTITVSTSLLFSSTVICFTPLFNVGDPEINASTPENSNGTDIAPPDHNNIPIFPSLPDQNEPSLEPEPEPEPEAIPIPQATYIRAKVDGLNVRSGAGTSYSIVGSINKGDMVAFISRSGNWYRTIYKNKTAYISANDAHAEIYNINRHENEIVENVIEEGLQLLGFPYVYGATRLHDGSGKKLSGFNATKFDCSSLTQYIYYYGANINLHTTTRTQVKQGTFVAKNDITRGDLIFFTNSQRYNNVGIERIGHVALYLGDNYILHTASDYAVIEEISSRRWSYYIETRRFL